MAEADVKMVLESAAQGVAEEEMASSASDSGEDSDSSSSGSSTSCSSSSSSSSSRRRRRRRLHKKKRVPEPSRRARRAPSVPSFLDRLPQAVRNRVQALRNIQDECDKVDALFLKAIHDLERKYAELNKPLYDRRFKIINAEHEPAEAEYEWNSEDEEFSSDDDEDLDDSSGEMPPLEGEEEDPREKPEVKAEEKEVPKEKPEVKAEEKEAPKEIPEIKAEEKDVPKEIPEVKAEEKEVPEKIPEVKAEEKEVPEEIPQVKAEEKEVPEEIPEIKAEEKEVPEEIPEVKAEEKEVPEEIPEVKAEEKEVPEEIPEVKAEEKEVPEEIPDVKAEEKEDSEDCMEVTSEVKEDPEGAPQAKAEDKQPKATEVKARATVREAQKRVPEERLMEIVNFKRARKGKPKSEAPKGIPDYWLTVLKNVDKLGPMIQKYDEPILKFLSDVSLKFSKPGQPVSYTFEFHFLPNPYFRNEVLVKTYMIRSKPDHNDPFFSWGWEIEDCKGCKIDWRRGKDVTVTTTESRTTATGEIEIQPRVVPNASFFNFFSPPEIPKIGKLEPREDAILDEDFEIGQILHDNVILKSIFYYTGEVNGTFYQDGRDYGNRKFRK
ncbi:PREDICTED: nucleosome assembly protein 1-like 3 isoform X2 [Propithecus coquereli]|uniref:nucleosome assembly protein 1-like 3 isoform X2 n=1 Tax=Propithecus coquereli TaxID=379532 RepID=UPI00063F932A|nr:PREDICTED: nucleosome assembly protein 1-like 3 isoform X2 [Propithecus coquereli]